MTFQASVSACSLADPHRVLTAYRFSDLLDTAHPASCDIFHVGLGCRGRLVAERRACRGYRGCGTPLVGDYRDLAGQGSQSYELREPVPRLEHRQLDGMTARRRYGGFGHRSIVTRGYDIFVVVSTEA